MVFPKFREEGPSRHLNSLLAATELQVDEGSRKNVKQLAYIILLGYRPVTVIAILTTLTRNGNRAMYGAELAEALEQTQDLPTGWYTKSRYYNDRIGRVLRVLADLEILTTENVSLQTSDRTTTGYKLAESVYQFAKHQSMLNQVPILMNLPYPSKVMKKCLNDEFVASDSLAVYCQFCGATLATVCAKCARQLGPDNKYCTRCGEKIAE